MKKIFKHIAVFSMLTMLFAPIVAVKALDINDAYGNAGNKTAVSQALHMTNPEADPRVIAANAIYILLGFLGILATVIILIAGFQWMTAAGDSAKVTKAKERMEQGAIGLVIIFSAWALSKFILESVIKVTGN